LKSFHLAFHQLDLGVLGVNGAKKITPKIDLRELLRVLVPWSHLLYY
jgi:hypothetical protein